MIFIKNKWGPSSDVKGSADIFDINPTQFKVPKPRLIFLILHFKHGTELRHETGTFHFIYVTQT